MSITIYQLLTPLFAIAMLLKGISQLKRSEITVKKFIIWICIWGGVSVLALYPGLAQFIARLTGLESGINALIFFGFILIFYLIFKVFTLIEQIERELTRLVRQKSLDDFFLNKSHK